MSLRRLERRRCRQSVFLIAGLHERVLAFPVDGDQTALPAKTELNEDALRRPREVFHSEITGRKSDLIKLGNLAFASPSILGNVAQQAGLSCETCHVNGAGNAKLFMPKMSTRPGNFDTTGPLFNPKADNGVLDPVRIPSLRGARYLAPYGADGRMASLRDFVRNVIVNEFAGAEPSAGHRSTPSSPISRISISCRTQASVPQAGWSAGSANRSAAAKRCSQSRSRMIPA